MKEQYIELLKNKIDNGVIKITFNDDEVVLANISSVSEAEHDIIYKIISSNRSTNSKESDFYLAKFDEIKSVDYV